MESHQTTILIVDDDEATRDSIAGSLRDFGFQIITAADGYAGLTAALSLPIDVVLTDVEMPNMTGLELLEQIRTLKPEVRIFVFSANAEKHRAEALRLGAAAIFDKPPDLQYIIGCFRPLVR